MTTPASPTIAEIPNRNRVLIFPFLRRSDSDLASHQPNRYPATLCSRDGGPEWWRPGAYHGKAPISRILRRACTIMRIGARKLLALGCASLLAAGDRKSTRLNS